MSALATIHQLQSALEAYGNTENNQAQVRAAMLMALDRHGLDGFLRTTGPGHFTASTYVTGPSGDRVLLMNHKKLEQWMPFGGHADGNDNLVAVAANELSDEAGIPFSLAKAAIKPEILHLSMGVYPAGDRDPFQDLPDAHLHLDVGFLAVLDPSMPTPGNAESNEVRWFSLYEALFLGGPIDIRPGLLAAHTAASLAS